MECVSEIIFVFIVVRLGFFLFFVFFFEFIVFSLIFNGTVFFGAFDKFDYVAYKYARELFF